MPLPPPSVPVILFDNGSLAPASTWSLRRIAQALAHRLGRPIVPASLLHSDRVPANELGGQPAEVLLSALQHRLAAGHREFLLVPLFFGPSGALTDYLPRRLAALQQRHPAMRVQVAPGLDQPGDPRLARMLAAQVRSVLAAQSGTRAGATADATAATAAPVLPRVLLVDHGSPQHAVAAGRDRLAGELAEELGAAVRDVRPASMERRPEPEFAFNEPLLAHALDQAAADGLSAIILALLFLSPGRHAGPGGDIDTLCAAACARHPQLVVQRAPLVGEHPDLIDLLVARAQAGWNEGA